MAMWSVLTPSSTRLTLKRLLTNSPAPASRSIDRATCVVTRPLRNQAAERAPDGWPCCPLSALTRFGLVLCSAGKSPNSSAVAAVTTAANRTIRPLSRPGHRTDRFGRHERDDEVERPARDEQAQRAAKRRQQARLGQQLPHEPPAARADRQAHGHLRRPAGRPRQQQVRDVGAGDQQDEPGDRQQQHQGRLRLP